MSVSCLGFSFKDRFDCAQYIAQKQIGDYKWPQECDKCGKWHAQDIPRGGDRPESVDECRWLWVGLIASQIDEACRMHRDGHVVRPNNTFSEPDVHSARHFIFGYGTEFKYICDLAGIQPEWVRRKTTERLLELLKHFFSEENAKEEKKRAYARYHLHSEHGDLNTIKLLLGEQQLAEAMNGRG